MDAGQPSPVNASDAQAFQEDLAKVLEEVASTGRRAVARITQILNRDKQQPQPEVAKEDLRIQKGRRVVYGETNRGFRNDLAPEDLKSMLQGIRQPVAEGANPENYKNKVPRFEIRLGDEVLFRQERDGVVTVNELQLEREAQQVVAGELQQALQLQDAQVASAPSSATAQQLTESTVAELLDSNSNELSERKELALPTDPPNIEVNKNKVFNSQQDVPSTNPLNYDTDGNGIGSDDATNNSSIPSQNSFDKFYQGITELFDDVYGKPDPRNHKSGLNGSAVIGTSQSANARSLNAESVAATPEVNKSSQAVSVVAQHSETQKSPAAQAKEVPPAFAIASAEINKAPESKTKELFKALLTELGKESQKLSKQAVDWVASRPDWIREQAVASTALKLFNDNYAKTKETNYQAENYSVKLQGVNHYQVNDRDGNVLMKFHKTPLGGIKVTQNQMAASDYQQFASARQSLNRSSKEDIFSQDSTHRVALLQGLAPRGDLEIVNSFKTKDLMTTAQNFMQNMGVERWDAGQKGNYNIERKGNTYLKIDSKTDGRGTVLLLKNGQMLTNNLESKDFIHFRKLEQVMHKDLTKQKVKVTTNGQEISAKQPAQRRPLPKKEVGLEL